MNNQGFSTLSFIVFLPLALILTFSVFWIVWFNNQKLAVENICHYHLLKAQDHLVSGNNKIMNLNFYAKFLIIQKRVLNVVIIVAPPPAKAAAIAQRKIVVAQQKILNKVQRSIIHLSNIRANGELFKLRRSFNEKNKEIKNFWNVQTSRSPVVGIFPKTSQIKIDTKDIASTYKRIANHESKQSFNAQWRIPIKRFLPNWVTQLVPVQNNWYGQCQTHPHQGEFKWRSAIGKGSH